MSLRTGVTLPDTFDRLKAALADRYAIERELGAGGMATVYLAQDLKHDRMVAIKVLRPELAAVLGAERFVQEIKTTANLQHPQILPLFDSGEADGFLYYVMPYIEGETLRDKLNREKQLAIEEAVKLTTEVAEALDYAHRHEVIHRDIKPENILLHDGRPVVADFGIALAVSQAAGARLTETGLSLGTPHYMSPEQAAGDRDVGARSDVYSLGCVVYEMLVGEPPHTGPSAQAVLARILTDEPRQVRASRGHVPPHVEAAVHRALEKLPADRFGTARAFADALTDATFASARVEQEIPAVRSWRNRVSAPVLTAVVLAVVALLGWMRPGRAPVNEVTRYHHGLPDGEQLVPTFGVSIAVSPDGARIAYVGPAEQGRQLWIRERDQLRARPLPGSEDAWQPFFAPDGRAVGFITGDRRLKVASLTGDPLLTLVDGGLNWGGTWAGDGQIYVSGAAGLMRLTAAGGGVLEPVTARDSANPEVLDHAFPDALPNGRGVLFTIVRNHLPSDIAVVDLSTGEHHVLVRGVLGRYAESGHLVYVLRDGALMAAPFDQDRLALTGTGVLLGNRFPAGIIPDLALSRTGRLVYAARPRRILEVVWVDRDGSWTPVDPDNPMRGIRYAALSPDGMRLAVTTWLRPPSNDGHLWIKQLPRGAFSRFTFQGVINMRPTWTPDGQSVAFISDRGDDRDVWVKRADGTRDPELLLDDPMTIDEAFYSPDGEWIVYRRGKEDGERDILAIRPNVDSVATPLVTSDFDEVAPALSADGRWLAYVANRAGQPNVYVRPFPEAATETQVSVNGGTEPVWARNGSELFYRNGAGEMVAVAVLPGSQFRFGAEQVLFPAAAYRSDFFHAAYDVTADGERFVMIREWDSGSLHEELIVVENWLGELRAKVGN